MPETAPVVRVDRDAWNKTYLQVAEQVLYRAALIIDALTAAGPLFDQLPLPPEQAALKRGAQ